jgi:succinate-semialdehyde dehydrogenase/glutarate-semialdehyde dehydrogenase
MPIQSIDPSNNGKLKYYEEFSKEQTLNCVTTAHAAFQEWRHTAMDERKRILLKYARLLRSNTHKFATLITKEMGKRISESEAEIIFCAEIAEFYANGAAEFLSDHQMDVKDTNAFIQYAPIGVLLGIMPWNFPFYQATRFLAPNLMVGNTMLLKHASNVPQCAEKIEQLLHESGLPEGVYINLFSPIEFMEPVISDSRVQGVSLTGSEKAGAAVASIAGKNLKRTVMELGGNDAFIVLEDADLEHTVEMAVKGRMANTGQSCVASKRFIVVEPLAEAFLAAFKRAMSGLKMGDPMDEDTQVGPLSTEGAAEDLAVKVKASIDAGATVILGGDRPDREGAYFNPTILTDITPDMPSYDQELFGPVASVYVVKDEAAAIELANDSSYGLGGSVYTTDLKNGQKVAQQIDTGMVFLNQPTNSQAELPFGGTKNSGYGRELSRLGIYEFVNKKLIHLGSN